MSQPCSIGFGDRYNDLANKYMGGKASAILTVGVKGGFDAGVKFYDALRLFKRLVNIGDAKSLSCHRHRPRTVS